MKRGTPRHPKMLRLLQALDLSPRHKATAIGHLELLWHFTAEFSPQGDIGRYGDDQIEGACEWYGRRGRLIQALTTSGWVDISDQYRLIVHDWKDHADESVRKRLTRGGLWFVDVTSKVTGHRQNKVSSVPDNGSLPEPCLARAMPEPEPNTPATPEFTLTPKEPNAETPPDQPRVVRSALPSPDWFSQWWKIYWPPKHARAAAEKAFRSKVKTEARFQRVMAATREQTPEMLSREPSKRPYGATWLNGERWEDESAAVPVNGSARPPGHKKTFMESVESSMAENLAVRGKVW